MAGPAAAAELDGGHHQRDRDVDGPAPGCGPRAGPGSPRPRSGQVRFVHHWHRRYAPGPPPGIGPPAISGPPGYSPLVQVPGRGLPQQTTRDGPPADDTGRARRAAWRRNRSGRPGLAAGRGGARGVSPMSVIEVHGLTKRFGPVLAVDQLSFEVGPGDGDRLPRRERRREDDHAADAARPGPAGRGHAPLSTGGPTRTCPSRCIRSAPSWRRPASIRAGPPAITCGSRPWRARPTRPGSTRCSTWSS